MSRVLLVQSSIFGTQSKSLGLAQEFLAQYPQTLLVERVLTPTSMPHLDAETFAAMAVPEGQRTERQKSLVALSDTLIAEIGAGDGIVWRTPTMLLNRKPQSNAKTTAALIGWGAALCIAFWAAPCLYASNDLIQWR